MDTSNKHAILRSAVFEGISDDAVADLFSRGEVSSFEANYKLFERGDEASKLMILQEGVVELLFPIMILGVTREVVMETKQPGSVVAWSSLVSPYQVTLSARCTSDCQMVSFTRDTLFSFFEANPYTGYLLMRNLAGVIGRRLQAMQTIWMHDLRASVTKRLE